MKSAGTIQKNAEKRASHDVLFSLCENAADKLILLVLLGSVLLFILWPIACIALRSLRGADGGVSFAMFGTVLRQYGESLRNSVFVGVFTAVLSTILSLSAALVCAHGARVEEDTLHGHHARRHGIAAVRFVARLYPALRAARMDHLPPAAPEPEPLQSLGRHPDAVDLVRAAQRNVSLRHP